MSQSPGPQPERLGILGGTFDPPHVGHIYAATLCRDRLGLDRVLLVVANDPWQKSPGRGVSPAPVRFSLVKAAIGLTPGLEPSAIELERGGPSYTVETVEAIAGAARAATLPVPEQFLIVGADVIETLPSWHRVEDLARLVTLVVIARPGVRAIESVPGWRSVVVSGAGVHVSSSMVRSRVAAGCSVEDLVPAPVDRCIRAQGLYAVGT